MTAELGPVHWPTGVPDHLQCARPICHRPRTPEGEHRYCSPECKRLSDAVHGDVVGLPATGWSWAP